MESIETQIADLKVKIANAEMFKDRANTWQQQDNDQRRIDALKDQLKELQS